MEKMILRLLYLSTDHDAFVKEVNEILASEAEKCAELCLFGTVNDIHENILLRAANHRSKK